VATTKLQLATGTEIEVEGPLDKVMKELEDAARSSAGTLARLTQAGTGDPIAIGAAHVVAVLPGDR
jgi:ABC-type tungstate transport system permease subunit